MLPFDGNTTQGTEEVVDVELVAQNKLIERGNKSIERGNKSRKLERERGSTETEFHSQLNTELRKITSLDSPLEKND